MYLVSNYLQTVTRQKLQLLEQEWNIILPPSYIQFLEQYGQGTYCGLLNVEYPDRERLREFAEYELWEHDEQSPITREQLAECIVIATTIDGDFVVVHPGVESLIWLPRHSEIIERRSCGEQSWVECMEQWIEAAYGPRDLAETKRYFEPWNNRQQHLFLMLGTQKAISNGSSGGTEDAESGSTVNNLADIARECAAVMKPDLIIDNAYSGLHFFRQFNGYVRFNYAYGREVAVFYEKEESQEGNGSFLVRLLQFMREHDIQ